MSALWPCSPRRRWWSSGSSTGIAVAVAASIVDHLRHSYSPLNSVLMKSPTGHWQSLPVTPGVRTMDGLVIYRFGTSLYYANAARLMFDILPLIIQGPPVQWLVLDCAAIGDIDYTASAVLAQAVQHVQQRHIRFAFSSVLGPVRQQLDLYGITKTLDNDACYDTAGAALEAFHARDGNRATDAVGTGRRVRPGVMRRGMRIRQWN